MTFFSVEGTTSRFVPRSSVNLEIFAKSAKRRIWHIQNSPIGHDLPTSFNDRVSLLFHNCFILTKLRCEVSRK